MKIVCISSCLIVWFILTVVLCISLVGLVVIVSQGNYTENYIPQEKLRSTWMRIGYDLKDELIK